MISLEGYKILQITNPIEVNSQLENMDRTLDWTLQREVTFTNPATSTLGYDFVNAVKV